MKMRIGFAVLALMLGVAGAQEKMSEQLRKAIVEEEANQNLDKAIAAYQIILAQFEEERKAAATALFHLADCYRKQGKKEQAVASYRRVIREFPEQAQLTSASSNQLVKTYGLSQSQSVTTASGKGRETSEYERQVMEARQRYRKALEMEIQLVESQIAQTERRIQIGTASFNEMSNLRKELLELQQRMAIFDAGGMPLPSATQK